MKFEPINPHIRLDDGEVLCKECNGWGYLKGKDFDRCCPRCMGRCVLDWIDNVRGQNTDVRWL